MADGVTVDEVALLARAMTYKLAVFEQRIGGAKAGIRPRLLDTHAETIGPVLRRDPPPGGGADVPHRRRPRLHDRRLRTVGASRCPARVFDSEVDGIGLRAARDRAGGRRGRGRLAGRSRRAHGGRSRASGRSAAGSLGRSSRRGGTVVAVSTIEGRSPTRPGSTSTRCSRPGPSTVTGSSGTSAWTPVPPRSCTGCPSTSSSPGRGPACTTAAVAAEVRAPLIVPAANVPYTVAGLDVLRRSRVVALPDFVCNAGAVLAYRAPRGLSPDEVLGRVDRLITERIEAAKLAKMDPIRYATVLADTFLTTWIPAEHRPDGPALAP